MRSKARLERVLPWFHKPGVAGRFLEFRVEAIRVGHSLKHRLLTRETFCHLAPEQLGDEPREADLYEVWTERLLSPRTARGRLA
jgi:hypothetical protein